MRGLDVGSPDRPVPPTPLRGVHGDRGAASVEHAGMVTLVGVLVSAALLAPMSDVIGPQVGYRICQAFDTLPGVDAGCSSPGLQDRVDQLASQCMVQQTDRELSLDGQVKIVRAEMFSTDQIRTDADGTGAVVLTQGRGVGVGTKVKPAKSDDGGVGFEANAMVSGDLRYHYNFPEEFGGSEAAEDFLHSRRGTTRRVVDTVVPGTQTVTEGVTRGVNAASNAWHGTLDYIGVKEDTGREDRRRAQQAAEADAVSTALSVSGLAGVELKSDLVEGRGELTGSVEGVVTASLNNGGPDAGDNQFTGTAQYDLSGGVTLGVPGDPQRGIDDLPPFLNIGGGMGQTGQYTVKFDENGDPAVLELTTQTRTSFDGGIEAGGARGSAAGEGSLSAQVGSVTEERRVLDLSDPDNRAAYDTFFTTVGLTIGDTSAKVAVPRSVGSSSQAPQLINDAIALWERTNQDALVINSEYDLYGSDPSASMKDSQGFGLGVLSAGVSSPETTIELTSATVQDNRTGGAAVPLASCEG